MKPRILLWLLAIIAFLAFVPVIVFGAVQTLIISLNPNTPATLVACVVIYGLFSSVALILQVTGHSLRDLLPPKSPRELDRDRNRLLKSTNGKLLFEEAKDAFDNKEYDWSFAFAEATIKIWSQHGDAHEIAGRSLIGLGEPDKAIMYGRKLTEMQPLEPDGYRILARAYDDMQCWKEAAEAYEKLMMFEVENISIYSIGAIANAYAKIGKVDEAIQWYQKELTLPDTIAPSKDIARNQLERLQKIKISLDANSSN